MGWVLSLVPNLIFTSRSVKTSMVWRGTITMKLFGRIVGAVA